MDLSFASQNNVAMLVQWRMLQATNHVQFKANFFLDNSSLMAWWIRLKMFVNVP